MFQHVKSIISIEKPIGIEKTDRENGGKYDGLVKSLKRRFSVIPAQAVPLRAGQYFHIVRILWIPVFTRMTTFYESIKYGLKKKQDSIKMALIY
jgi:hypothetical protein